jgi:hypothetical protein
MFYYGRSRITLEEFYNKSLLSSYIKDHCIVCRKVNVVQIIISMRFNGKDQYGPLCNNCWNWYLGYLKKDSQLIAFQNKIYLIILIYVLSSNPVPTIGEES